MSLSLASICLHRMHLPEQRGVCSVHMEPQIEMLNLLAQDYTKLQCLNRKLTEFHSVLQKALKDSQRLSWDSQNHCQSQASSLNHSPVQCVVSIRRAAVRAIMCHCLHVNQALPESILATGHVAALLRKMKPQSLCIH